MHKLNIKPNVLCLTNKQFTKSFEELKEDFDFNLIFLNNNLKDISNSQYQIIIVDSDILEDQNILKYFNNLSNVGKLLILNSKDSNQFIFDDKIEIPLSVNDLNKKVVQLITSRKFSQNSSIKIKDYILDKNEKKFKKDDQFIIVTEKEIQLLELLFFEKKPLTKKDILQKVWHYSSEADTHTVETHIYRLRKKISSQFKDEELIISSQDGYLI
jgi:DNA-binding response OmpR family regulator